MTPNIGIHRTTGGPIYWLLQTSANLPASTGAGIPPWLAAGEAEYYAALKRDKRRRDWLLGRWTAKQLIRSVLSNQSGLLLGPEMIAILRHTDGWPLAVLPEDAGTSPLALSISHSGDRAFCALALGDGLLLGCDIEAVAPRSTGFIEDYFTVAEREWMDGEPQASISADVLANAIWSGKESALKAIRRGLAEDTRLANCRPEAQEGPEGWRPLGIRWEQSERDLPPLQGWWRPAGEFVLTLAVGHE